MHHQLDLADAVLEADQVRAALAQPLEGVGVQAADVAVVDHDADADGAADGLGVRREAVLRGLGQVVGEAAAGPRRRAARPPGRARRPYAWARPRRRGSGRGRGRSRPRRGRSRGTRPASSEKNSPVPPDGEERARSVGREPLQPPRVAFGPEVARGVEVGDRERQQPGRESRLQLLWVHVSRAQ